MDTIASQPTDFSTPDAEKAFADKLLQPLLQWLEKIGCTPQRFCEVLKSDQPHEDRAGALGISTESLREGLDAIPSLKLYAEIVGLTDEELWKEFELNRHLAPRWLLRRLEGAVRDHFASLCQTGV